MPRLKSPPPATDPRNVSYADLRASDLVIHHMPGHLIRRLQQVAVRIFFARVGIDLTPVQFAALARAMPAVRAVQDTLLQSLDAGERRHFERLCLRILAHHLGYSFA